MHLCLVCCEHTTSCRSRADLPRVLLLYSRLCGPCKMNSRYVEMFNTCLISLFFSWEKLPYDLCQWMSLRPGSLVDPVNCPSPLDTVALRESLLPDWSEFLLHICTVLPTFQLCSGLISGARDFSYGLMLQSSLDCFGCFVFRLSNLSPFLALWFW